MSASYSRRGTFGRKGRRDFTAAAMVLWEDDVPVGAGTARVDDLVRSFDQEIQAPVVSKLAK